MTAKKTKHDSPGRALSLDALRGWAILMMVFSGTLPWSGLPPWMYHAQVPPPDRIFNPELAGMTWVDWVFPLFLFAMGAAFPFAFQRRMDKGIRAWRLWAGVAERTLLLGFFAVFLQHIRPFVLQAEPGALTWLTSLAGFGILFLIFTRFPAHWTPRARWGLRIVGWGTAFLLLGFLTYPGTNGEAGFSVWRRDIILIILTNAVFFGGALWLAVRGRPLLLVGAMGVILGFRLSMSEPGWTHVLGEWSPLPWLLQVGMVSYLLVVIPGMIAGGMLLQWQQEESFSGKPSEGEGPSLPGRDGWSDSRLATLGLLAVGVPMVLLVGLQERWLWQTNLLLGVAALAGFFLIRGPSCPTERLLARLVQWGLFWLLIGLTLEPYQGGIKKDPATFSYFFISAGMSVFLLAGLFILTDLFRKDRWVRILIHNGQNPMIAYVGYANFILPVFALLGLHGFMMHFLDGPLAGLLRAFLYTALVALLVSLLTKRKIFWRT